MTLRVTAREFLRGTLHSFGLTRVIDLLRQARGNRFTIDKRAPVRDRFAAIYQNDLWKMNEDQPSSGEGSSEHSAQNVIATLPKVVSGFGISSLLDIGCGDFTWMKKIELPCSYTGIDIVPSVITRNQKKYSTAQRSFICLDAITEDIPAADAVLCREVLFHLSFADSMNLIRNVYKSGSRFFLTTTERATGYNSDIDSGDWRILNLQIAPYNFGPPIMEIADDSISAGRIIGLWRLEDFPAWAKTRSERPPS
jgi:2-polyprenyl-3-methyl-5-hydroxy-6-metoxy-1,4-benzoquinol methylase